MIRHPPIAHQWTINAHLMPLLRQRCGVERAVKG